MIEQIHTYREAEEYISAIPKFSGKNSMEYTKLFFFFSPFLQSKGLLGRSHRGALLNESG